MTIITRLLFISSLLITMLAITPESTAQNTAIMNVSVEVISGVTVSSEMNERISFKQERVNLGELNLLISENQDYLIILDEDTKVSNEKGDVLRMTATISNVQSISNSLKRYKLEGKVQESGYKRRGLYKGRINATINYL